MIGILYIATGLLIEYVYITMTGAMLGMTTPIFTISSFVVAPLFAIGPSLMLFSGITTTLPNLPRGKLCLITGTILVAALALWTAPRIGWRYSGWLVLEPVAISLPIAYLVLLLSKKRWISALIGSGLSAPYCVLGTGYVLYQNIFGAGGGQFSVMELWLIIPGAVVTASFISSLCFRDS
jgi:hypothetical protein